MTKNQTKKKSANYKLLLQDLRSYGLNPEDWQLARKGRAEYQISKKSDHSFSLFGKSRNSKKWQSLELSDY